MLIVATVLVSCANRCIYLSEQFINDNADNTDLISKVIIEEIGHYIDAQVNLSDAAGDEGAIFASLVTGETLDAETLADLQAEDDSATIELDGESIAIEKADNIIYVDKDATDGEDSGTTWANAYTDLQDALDEAESGDEIWVAAGTYKPTKSTDRDVSFDIPSGVKVRGGFAGDETELSQRDTDENVTILSGDIGTNSNNTDNSYIVVNISETNKDTVLEGLTIEDGNNDQDQFNSFGGGIYSEESNATLANLIIQDNNSAFGGGLYAVDSRHRLLNVNFDGNSATRNGGGIYNDISALIFEESTFNDNFAEDNGGAIYTDANNDELVDITLTDTTFNSNRANDDGGAIYNGNTAIVNANNVKFFNNTAIVHGGAIYNETSSSSDYKNTSFLQNTAITNGGAVYNTLRTTQTFADTIFKDNIANNVGGGIYNQQLGSTRVVNSVFDSNISRLGGAIYDLQSNSSTINTTFSNNISRSGSAVVAFGRDDNFTSGEDYITSVNNSIIWGNRSYVDGQQITNLETDAILNVNNSIVEGNDDGENVIDENPQFVNPAILDYRLQAGSPALNQGDNEVIEDFTTDLADNPRVVDENVDLGAYEGAQVGATPTLPTIINEPTIIYVDKDATGEDDGASWRNAYTDLQGALEKATFGSQIWVAEGTYVPTEDDDRDISFQLKNGVEIYGGFTGEESELNQRDVRENVTILSGEIGQTDNQLDNTYNVVNASNTNNSAILDGFYIQDGQADIFADDNTKGGGIYSYRSQAILSNLVIRNNFASGDGGGMYSEASVHQINNVLFINNQAGVDGGGLYADNSGSILSNVTFEDNQAQSGGAIYNDGSGGFSTNVTFKNNQATTSAGAIYNSASSPVFDRAYFIENTTDGSGGAIFNSFVSNPSLNNVLFRENTAVTSGGAIHNNDDDSGEQIVNGVFDGNSSEFGGAIYNNSANPSGINVTFTNNQADTGAAIYSTGDDETTPTYNNSIFWANDGVLDPDPIVNEDDANTIVAYSLVEGDYPGEEIIDANPGFGGSNNLLLSPNSPAVNAGLNDPIESLIDTDLVGNNRITNGTVDLGAYEYRFVTLTDSDLLWRDPNSGKNSIWEMEGTEVAEKIALGDVVNPDLEIQAYADFDKDGEKDLLWRDTDEGTNSIWLLDGGERKERIALDAIPDTGWNIKGTGDFDKDGNQDILWRDELTGNNTIWLMDGTTKRSEVDIDPAGTDFEIAGVGDMNKDGYDDIILRNQNNGENYVRLMDGTNQFRQSVQITSVGNTDWEIVGVGSFNSGTNLDLVWRNTETGENTVWLMDGLEKTDTVSLPEVANTDFMLTI